MTCSSWKVREGEVGKGVGIDCTNHNISRIWEKSESLSLEKFLEGEIFKRKKSNCIKSFSWKRDCI